MNIMVFTTFSNMEEARRIAGILLEEKAAACVQLKEIESLYMWKGKIEEDREIQGLIKTRRELFDMVEEIIKREHSYEVPQIVAVDIESGSEAYLQWIGEVTRYQKYWEIEGSSNKEKVELRKGIMYNISRFYNGFRRK